jgi:2',3'-cyclic-nucleotide 2'-phosphodiesterase (5'-nucleotidase family)
MRRVPSLLLLASTVLLELALVVTFVACATRPPGPVVVLPRASDPRASPVAPASSSAPSAVPSPATVTISVVGTNDVHGRLASLPVLAGYLANLRAARAAEEGAVVLLDGGDMFQGTLESNLNEGAAMIEGYGALGYTAVTVGNHEFDFGPEGPRATAREGEDPRGALRARARAAGFPLLTANLATASDGSHPGWANMPASVVVERAGVRIGILGVTTEETPRTTLAANFRGLAVVPLTEAVARGAAALRAQGCALVLLAAHAGGRCRHFDDPRDTTSCDADQEIVRLANALPAGTLDAIVAGHTHAGVAHFIHGIPVLESYANGRAFGRVDLVVERATGRVHEARIQPPHALCGLSPEAPACADERYEGAPVVPDAALEARLAPAFRAAAAQREQALGVTLAAPFARSGGAESPLGNLLADLLRAQAPGGADVALVNGGGIRTALPAGPLNYGALYETFPFDNRFAVLELRGAELRRVLAANLSASESLLSISGVRVEARCRGAVLDVRVLRQGPRGERPIGDAERLRVATSDFVATGGDALLASLASPANLTLHDDGPTIRDASAEALRARGGTLRPDDPAIFDPARPRWVHAGSRPVRCTAAPDAATPASAPPHSDGSADDAQRTSQT